MEQQSLYQGKDPRELPAYGVTEAARYLHMPVATLRSWVKGRRYDVADGYRFFESLISLPDPRTPSLSFTNLIEAHVLRALCTRHGVSIQAVRTALSYAEQKFRIERLLLSNELKTAAGELFLEKYGQLISLSKSGQLAVKKLLEAYLQRVDRDAKNFPIRLYPFIRSDIADEQRIVVIDPLISFGKPIIAGKGISTSIIVQRYDAGETLQELMEDYDLQDFEIEAAILYEQAA